MSLLLANGNRYPEASISPNCVKCPLKDRCVGFAALTLVHTVDNEYRWAYFYTKTDADKNQRNVVSGMILDAANIAAFQTRYLSQETADKIARVGDAAVSCKGFEDSGKSVFEGPKIGRSLAADAVSVLTSAGSVAEAMGLRPDDL